MGKGSKIIGDGISPMRLLAEELVAENTLFVKL